MFLFFFSFIQSSFLYVFSHDLCSESLFHSLSALNIKILVLLISLLITESSVSCQCMELKKLTQIKVTFSITLHFGYSDSTRH